MPRRRSPSAWIGCRSPRRPGGCGTRTTSCLASPSPAARRRSRISAQRYTRDPEPTSDIGPQPAPAGRARGGPPPDAHTHTEPGAADVPDGSAILLSAVTVDVLTHAAHDAGLEGGTLQPLVNGADASIAIVSTLQPLVNGAPRRAAWLPPPLHSALSPPPRPPLIAPLKPPLRPPLDAARARFTRLQAHMHTHMYMCMRMCIFMYACMPLQARAPLRRSLSRPLRTTSRVRGACSMPSAQPTCSMRRMCSAAYSVG